jgi:hypothetical protein
MYDNIYYSSTKTAGDTALVVGKTVGYVAIGIAGATAGVVVGAAAIPFAAVALVFGTPIYFVSQLLKGPSAPPPSVVAGFINTHLIEKVFTSHHYHANTNTATRQGKRWE